MTPSAEFNQNIIASIPRAAYVICRYQLSYQKRLIKLPDYVINVINGSRHEPTELCCESVSEVGLVLFRSRRNSELRHAVCKLVGGQVPVNECSKLIQVNRIRERLLYFRDERSVLGIMPLAFKSFICPVLICKRHHKIMASSSIEELDDIGSLIPLII